MKTNKLKVVGSVILGTTSPNFRLEVKQNMKSNWEKEFDKFIKHKLFGKGVWSYEADDMKDFILQVREQARQEGIESVRNIVVETTKESREPKVEDELKGLYLYSRILTRIDELKKK